MVPDTTLPAASTVDERLDPPSPFIGKRIGSYRLVQEIGKGGFGAVLLAVHDHSEAQKAAVQVLYAHLAHDPKVVKKFFDEARAVGTVPHPGLVKIFDFGKLPDGTVYILMELLHGETLSARLDRLHEQGARLQLGDALRIARQTASALSAVHEQGIFHRDIKPENVFLVPDPEAAGRERAKVLDFGIAKFRDASSTQSNQLIGAVSYMSPEQCRVDAIDGKTDVYSLGIMLFQMIAGRLPFEAAVPHAVLMQHLTQAPPLLRYMQPGVPASVHDLVHQMLAKDRAERPTMQEVLARLEVLSTTASAAAVPVVRGRRGRSMLGLGVGGLAVAGLVGLLGYAALRPVRAPVNVTKAAAPAAPVPSPSVPETTLPGTTPAAPAAPSIGDKSNVQAQAATEKPKTLSKQSSSKRRLPLRPAPTAAQVRPTPPASEDRNGKKGYVPKPVD